MIYLTPFLSLAFLYGGIRFTIAAHGVFKKFHELKAQRPLKDAPYHAFPLEGRGYAFVAVVCFFLCVFSIIFFMNQIFPATPLGRAHILA